MKARWLVTVGGGALAVGASLPMTVQAHEGFYAGIEAGINKADKQSFTVTGADGFIGLGAIPDGTTITTTKFDLGYVGGLFAGYALSNGLRLELEATRRQDKFDEQRDLDGAYAGTSGKNTSDSATFNLWYDLFKGGSFHPYIGGGYGISELKIDDPDFQGTDLDKQTDNVQSYQLGAGVAFDVSPHLMVSLDYRYFDTEKGDFDFVETTPDSQTEADYTAQSVMLGLRYYFSAVEEPAPVVEAPPEAPAPEVVPVAAPVDSDGDGITDDLDQCPGTPVGVKVNDVGCPLPECKTPEPGQPIDLNGCATGDVIVLRGVNFEFNQARLTANAQGILDGVADSLNKAQDIKVELGGHTDGKGTDEYNQKLSERRANSVVQYLTGKGIDPGRMTAVGYGETQPVADNETDEGRELNRRVELKVTSGTAVVAPVVPAADSPQ